MVEKVCAHCGKRGRYAREAARFCQFCGAEFPAEEGQSAAEEILRRAERETDYARKRALYQQALEADENCLEAWKQLAFLGRLGEKGGKPDFSRIPSWPLDCLFQPREYKREQRAEMLRLLLHNAPYLAALAKVPDAAAFRREYLTAMAAHSTTENTRDTVPAVLYS